MESVLVDVELLVVDYASQMAASLGGKVDFELLVF
jgi:hypothetical protein